MMLAPCLLGQSRAPEALGQFGQWGAFRGGDATHCYAIAQPARARRDEPAYITVSSWPARRLFRQIHVRFRGAAGDGATLTIGERRFPIATAGADGWPSPTDGRQIVRLVREGGALRVTARIDGRRSSDTYALAGAASAIDAADLACLRGR
jgi:hypothetical protein